MKKFIREFIIYFILFILLSLSMHITEWLSYPIVHIQNLAHNVFPLHPFVYTFILYVVVFIMRVIFGFIIRLFRKRS